MNKLKEFCKKHRNLVLVFMDIAIVICSYILAILFLGINANEPMILIREMFFAVLFYQLYLNTFQMYLNMTRYEIGKDYVKYMFIGFISTMSIIILSRVFDFSYLGIKLNVLAGIFISGLFVLYRLAGRSILNRKSERAEKINEKNTSKPENLLIIGAGMGAREIIIAIKNSMKKKYNIIGIIDDNTNKVNHTILGIKVIGTRYDIPNIVKEYKVELIFLAINKITPASRQGIIEICQTTGIKTRVLPTTEEIIEKQGAMRSLRDVEIEDLLGRDEIKIDNKDINRLIKDKTVLVTGGGGSIGSELCRQVMNYNPKALIMLDIYENNLYDIELEMKRLYPETQIEAVIASVRDRKRLEEVFDKYRPDLVFHAAAHKHVPLMENNGVEAIKNNVFGTFNTVEVSEKYGVERFIMISTDKAVNPTNIMGASKRICEMIVQAKSKTSKTKFVAVRFGNVLGSNGSVIPLFKKQIANGGPVTVTDQRITRFFMTISEAIQLILQATAYAKGGEIFVLDMGKPVKIYDLAVSLIKLSGYEVDKDIQIQFTGLRPGEKLYEELLMAEEELTATKHNKIFISKPMNITMQEVTEKLEALKMLQIEDCSNEKVKAIIKEVVPTYYEPVKELEKVN